MEKVRSVCPLNCPDTCSLTVYKEAGKIVRVTGNEDHPVTRGVICNKVRHFHERVYHPDRLLYPLRRVGQKGEGRFERISWEEAYAEIASRLRGIVERDGAERVLPYSFYGNMGVLNSEGMDRRFFNRLGASRLARTICNAAGAEGYRATMGAFAGVDPEESVHAKLIVLWGCNAVSTNLHQMLYANEARKQGAQVVVIDVHRNRTAKWADWFVAIRPGTDAALALGMMHVMMRESFVDEAFVERHTTGFAELKQQVEAYPPERVAEITGVSVDDILRLARLYGSTSPSFLRIGNGLQHHDNGGMTVRTLACLPALTGQWGLQGGGALKENAWYAQFNSVTVQRPELHQNPRAKTFNMNQLGDALLLEDKPLKALFVYNSNPAQVAPDQNKVRAGLMREDLFTVVHDLFLTDTCKYADIVLPATSHFENLDLYKSYWHLYVQLHEPVIEPQGECKSNFTLFQELAQHMGFEDACFQTTEEEMIREALDHRLNPYLAGITFEELQQHGFAKLDLNRKPLFPDHIPTRSGKIEFYSEALERKGHSPVPAYVPLQDDNGLPFQFVSGPNHQFLNSTFANLASLQNKEGLLGKPLLHMHPEDAATRGIETGDALRVWNERGECHLHAHVVLDVLPGVVVTQGLWWEDEQSGYQSVNTLTSQRLADMGGGATFFSTRVDVEKVIKR
jgi:anaerobic selenocysteine-containing dehydrogenase